ncbi:MAG TPA: hypothetical protein VHY58_02475 [Streptosporangiaceae bacterium]|jgi:hypothetical protein|nr:hypothetical protein [Streptosporangiaceae bacterium]
MSGKARFDTIVPVGPPEGREVEPGSTYWQQCFSLDGGQTWKANWTITSTRIAEL